MASGPRQECRDDPAGAAHLTGLLLGETDRGGPATGFGDAPQLDFRVAEALLALVERSSREAPMMLVIDDIQWADAATLLALAKFAPSLQDVPAVLVCAARPLPRSPEMRLVTDALDKVGATRIVLGALGDDEVADVTRRLLDAEPGPQLVWMLARACGNPLFVNQARRARAASAPAQGMELSHADGAQDRRAGRRGPFEPRADRCSRPPMGGRCAPCASRSTSTS